MTPFISAAGYNPDHGLTSLDAANVPLSAWLLRSYLDLGDHSSGPLFVLGVEACFRALVDREEELPLLQLHPLDGLRRTFASDTGLPGYSIEHVAELAPELRTQRWNLLLELLENHLALPAQQRGRLCCLLGSMGFYADLASVGTAGSAARFARRPAIHTLVARPAPASRLIRPLYTFVLASLAAKEGCEDSRVELLAALALLAQEAGPDRETTSNGRTWLEVAEHCYQTLRPAASALDRILTSLYFRILASVGLAAGRREAAAEYLSEAGQYSSQPAPASETGRLVDTQDRYALLEVQRAYALAIDRPDHAIQLAEQLRNLNPLDPEAHLQLADTLLAANRAEEALCACRRAASLGPPRLAEAWRTMARCHRLLGQVPSAREADAYAARFGSPFEVGDRRQAAQAAQPVEESTVTSAGLLRPYFDLGGDGGPIHARALMYVARALNGKDRRCTFQNNTPSFLRRILLWETGLTEYVIRRPQQLPVALRTPAWDLVCELLDRWPHLPGHQLLELADLLNRLGLYHATLDYLSESFLATHMDPALRSSLLGRKAVALIKTGHPRTTIEPLLEAAAGDAGPGSKARVAASVYLTVHHAKISGCLPDLEHWAAVSEESFLAYRRDEGETDPLFVSIYLRGLAYLPFKRKQWATLVRTLDQAEQYARQAMGSPAVIPLAAEENLFALLETRIKEASALGDLDLAVERARALVRQDCTDPRSHLHLGDVLARQSRLEPALAAFREAARIGAPYTPRAWYSAAQCLERLGDASAAMDAYLQSLRVDPWGVTPLLRVHRLATTLRLPGLKRWAAERIHHLRSRNHTAGIAAERDINPRTVRASIG